MINTKLRLLRVDDLHALGQFDSVRNALRLNGPAFCFLVDDEPVAAGGIVRLGARRGVAWVLLTEQAKCSAFVMRRIHNHVKTQLPMITKALNFEQIDAEADERNPRACAWLEYFGFKRKPIVTYSWKA